MNLFDFIEGEQSVETIKKVYSFDPTDDVETQWTKWRESINPDEIEDITEDRLKEIIIKDLSFVSSMDVKEYTLYQKWCEVQEKYPTEQVNTFDGIEKHLIYPEQKKIIDEVKNNIWRPESPDDYLDIEPVLVYTDDSYETKTTSGSIDGSEYTKKVKRSNLPEVWNTARTFISTMKNNSNIGRNLNFLVKDNKSNKYLGVICISSDFLDLTPRDSVIGWDRTVKTQGRMINYTAIGSTIVPFQPLGFNYVGGKLLALLCLSDEVQRLWKKQYGDVLVGVTTTSLYGKTKANGLSQYDNLDHWQPMGFTSGSVSFEPRSDTKYLIRDWLKKNHTRKYFEWYIAKNPAGQPYKRDHKNRSLNFVYSKLNVPKELIRSEHARGIYFSPLYNNSYEFLRKEIGEDQLVKSFDTSYEAITKIWKEKHARGRIGFLKKKNRVSTETLFYDDLICLDWNETRDKYLQQVGR
jgi:hypothetical protein